MSYETSSAEELNAFFASLPVVEPNTTATRYFAFLDEVEVLAAKYEFRLLGSRKDLVWPKEFELRNHNGI
jgi:hypothetical protein